MLYKEIWVIMNNFLKVKQNQCCISKDFTIDLTSSKDSRCKSHYCFIGQHFQSQTMENHMQNFPCWTSLVVQCFFSVVYFWKCCKRSMQRKKKPNTIALLS
ncbi:hypothetical protein BD560DRAFT_425189 [Blakeslea trispora]|nr:hypothetical protein BD560DRAFT_425189 [Blakeslea trispora]